MKVAVLCGGRSSEHPVSLASARAVLDGLEQAAHELLPIIIGRDGVWREADPREARRGGESPDILEPTGQALSLTPARGLLGADVAFPVLHGPFGEDGTVQGLLKTLDVAYVGSGVLASALCMDKAAFKRAMAQTGVPQVRYEVLTASEWERDREGCIARAAALGFPQFTKPARLGSSLGIVKATSVDELPAAIETGLGHDPVVLAEAAASGIEVECSVIGDEEPIASEPGQITAHADWYDYDAKYREGGMALIVPAPIAPAQRQRVRNIARNAFREVGASGLARVDFFVTDQGQVLLNELNTMPGFTSTSVFTRLLEASGIGYVELLDKLLGYALARHERERAFSY